MFNLRLCNAATIRYSLLKFGHMHLCGKDYKYFSPHCCKYNSFGCIAAIRCVNACHGPHSDSVYSGSEHRQFNSPRLVKREAGFPNPRRALIGSNQLWRVNDSPYYREYSSPTALPPPPLSVLIRRPSPLLPYAPDSLLPPTPFHTGPGLLDPSSDTPCQPHFPFRFPVHRLHWSRHSLSPPCPFHPSSVLQTSVGPGLLIPSAFYTPPPPPPPPCPQLTPYPPT